jgi:serine palmitoyltransferase
MRCLKSFAFYDSVFLRPGSALQAAAMSPIAAEQALAALDLLQGKDGSSRGIEKIAQLKENSNWFREQLIKEGFHVLGDWDSPVMPVMLYLPGALRRFSEICLKKSVAVVVVGFPATSLLTARARVCISAAHTRADLEYSLRVLKEAGEECGCLYRL